jgi:DNA polymerase-1
MPYLIVDGMNLLHRSYHAFMEMQTAEGVPSGHIYGFLVSLQSQKKKHTDCKVIVAWDSPIRRRCQIYAAYKANRSRVDFRDGLQDIMSVLANLNVTQAIEDGEEADDVIATLAKKYSQEGELVYIYSKDKDLLQLVQDGKVIAIWPKSPSNPEKAFDEEAVREKFGVDPVDLGCYLAFRGDGVDNVPGAPRLRSRTISHLARTHHNPDSVYASLDSEELTDFERKTLLDFESQSHINWQLVSLRDDFDPQIIRGRSNEAVVDAILQKYQIKKIEASQIVDIFEREDTFTKRTSPPVKEHSLF